MVWRRSCGPSGVAPITPNSIVQWIGEDRADETHTKAPTVSGERQRPGECVGQLGLPVPRGARYQVLQPASGPSEADPSSLVKEVVHGASPGPVHEPWTALFATLTAPAQPSQVNWPDSRRHVVRCLGGIDENGTERAPRFETGPRVDVDTLVLAALSRGPMTLERLARATGRRARPLGDQLARMRREGRVYRVEVGVWASTAPSGAERKGT